ncbi:MAG: hypothetical protein QNI91_18175 [Arenicellales bacterium]|nr:hypothetical protein [Arenicellales bacterium]
MLTVFIVMAVVGCTSIGPKTIPRDRSDYIDSVATSWKRQTLLNIVKLRYADAPVFLEVAQIVSGYTVQSTIAAEAGLTDFQDRVLLEAEGSFTDRPTVTYSPLTGDNFVRKLLSPIPPGAVLSLIQAGWAADLVLRTTVQAVNGQRNQSGLEPRQTPGDEDFYLLIELLREIQRSGAFGMRVEERDDIKDTTVLFFYHETLDPNVAVMISSLKDVLGLDPQAQRFKVAYGAIPSGKDEIAILTRSAIQIMMEIASYIEVPPQHLTDNLTRQTTAVETDIEAEITPLIRIKSGPEKPAATFAEVEYEDHWFWIEAGDFGSKRIFTFLMLILMLSETGQGGKLPVLTIPAG